MRTATENICFWTKEEYEKIEGRPFDTYQHEYNVWILSKKAIFEIFSNDDDCECQKIYKGKRRKDIFGKIFNKCVGWKFKKCFSAKDITTGKTTEYVVTRVVLIHKNKA